MDKKKESYSDYQQIKNLMEPKIHHRDALYWALSSAILYLQFNSSIYAHVFQVTSSHRILNTFLLLPDQLQEYIYLDNMQTLNVMQRT